MHSRSNSSISPATVQECADLKSNDAAATATEAHEPQTAHQCLQRTDICKAESTPQLPHQETRHNKSNKDPNWKQVLDTASQHMRDAIEVSKVVGLVCETVHTFE